MFLPFGVFGNVGVHTLYIKDDGSLWGMGSNSHGQLGNGTTTDLNTTQELIEANSSNPIIEITHGYNHSLFLRADGSLWGMGMNNFGQLGDGTTTHRSAPVKIVDSDVVRISAGYYHSLFLDPMVLSGEWAPIPVANWELIWREEAILL